MARTPVVRGGFGSGVRAAGVLLAFALVFTCWAAGARAALPDGRAYELVSPAEKNGGDVLLDTGRTRAAASGDALGFGSLTGFGDVHGTAISTDYIARRGATGWVTHGITPLEEPLNGALLFSGPGDAIYEGEFSSDLAHGVVNANAFPGGTSNVEGVQNLFVRDDLLAPGAGTYSLLSDAVDPVPPAGGGTPPGYRPYFAGASSDFSHVIFESLLNLTADATGTDPKLYEWDGGTAQLVGILPASEGGGLAIDAVAGRGAAGLSPFYTSDAISDDGSRIFFTVPSSGQLYMRVNASSTVRINASEKTVPDPTPGPATFQAATPDGSKVFFMSAEQLTGDDDNTKEDLYRYDSSAPAGERLTRLSVDTEPSDGTDVAHVLGLMGVSSDGDWAYFVASGSQLVAGAPIPSNSSAPLVYAWQSGSLAYVAKLNFNTDIESNIDATWLFHPKTARVAPDGKHLLFVSSEGDQVTPHDHGTCGALPCQEVYVYSAEANGGLGELACASCDPGVAPGSADADFRFRVNTGGSRTSSHLNHPLSDDGRWVFFNTSQRLLPGDRNAEQDVYQYDVLTGELHLLSTGDPDAGDAYFLDASASGRDVFFATREQLVGWDDDASYDVYDARVGGGFPEPAPPAPPCAGAECRSQLSVPPILQASASSVFHGTGNVKAHKKPAKKCRKGKVRKRVKGKVRCVKKATHHRRSIHRKGRGR